MAPAWRSCLKTMRLWTCSPVATLTGATALRTAACPRTSSGLVGSSIQYGSNSARALVQSMASSTFQRWLASIAMRMPGPTTERATRQRRTSSVRSAPTFSLIWVKPSATASAASRVSFSSL